MNKSLLLLPLLLPGCVIQIGGRDEDVRAERQESFRYDGQASALVVRTHNGRVEITPGDCLEGEILYHAYGPNEEEARRRVDELDLDTRREGERLVLELKRSSGSGGWNRGARLTLRVPPDMDLDIDTSNGSIRAETGTGTEVRLDSSNGRLELTGSPSSFDLDTSNGGVRVELVGDWDGQGKVHTSNGSIRLACSGRLSSTITARTSNGRITPEGSRPIQLLGEAPADTSHHISLRTSNGSITIRQED